MIKFSAKDNNANCILLIGAHCDDIEIGCGGTVQRLLDIFPNAKFYWLVLSSNKIRKKEAMDSANYFLSRIKNRFIDIHDFKNGYFPYIGYEIKEYFDKLKNMIHPDIIFTHYGKDLHQDHRITSELTWNTFRDNFILEYEILKYDGGLNTPNAFFEIGENYMNVKIDGLLRYFQSEANKHWFTESSFKGLMRLRGVECNSSSGFAEAFYCRKICF